MLRCTVIGAAVVVAPWWTNELAFSVVALTGLFLDQTNQQAAWKELLHPIAAELLALVWRQVLDTALWDSERHASKELISCQ